MILQIINHQYEYDMKQLCTVFFPYEKINAIGTEESVIIKTEINKNLLRISAKVYDKVEEGTHTLLDSEDEKTEMSVLLYRILSGILGFEPPWGILYGVRPAKLMHRLVESVGEEAAVARFTEECLAVPEKTALTRRVMHSENEIIKLSHKSSFSLYVSIPFCPSRCSYCSFVSHTIENTKKLIAPYVDLLVREIEETGKVAKALSLRLESIYFGGGTPTALESQDLKRLFSAIEKHFDLSNLREYTVEAGRPDTVTENKLQTILSAGVSRISINPQSFNDNVLSAIGRRHTVRQTIDAYELARNMGFDNINMDFIAGLPEDDPESFRKSIEYAVSLSAESVTVHTLSLKSGAYMVTKDMTFDLKDRITVSKMVDSGAKILNESGYHPYYMYRQSKSLGNLENVGWSKKGYECLYNVFMMDETHTVLSVGASAVTKLKSPKSDYIERIYNYKYPYEYIDNFDELLGRKSRIHSFYEEYN